MSKQQINFILVPFHFHTVFFSQKHTHKHRLSFKIDQQSALTIKKICSSKKKVAATTNSAAAEIVQKRTNTRKNCSFIVNGLILFPREILRRIAHTQNHRVQTKKIKQNNNNNRKKTSAKKIYGKFNDQNPNGV